MKKLMVLAAVAAMALGAKADYTVGYCYFGNAKGDESPAKANLQYYQAYVIQYAGGDEGVLAHVQKQGVAGIQKAALAQYNSTSGANKWDGEYHQYGLFAVSPSSPSQLDIPQSEAYAVVYYGQGDAVSEFEVMGNSGTTNIHFDDSEYKSGWQTYTAPQPQPGPVPEPTSGLLLLLGMAGLALRRKLNG